MDKINKRDYFIFAGDLNASVGNKQMTVVVGTNDELTLNGI
jgi:hypothetical protein